MKDLQGMLPEGVAPVEGASALHAAARAGHAEEAARLLEAGAFVDARIADTGETPLHWAATTPEESDALEVTRILLAGGARPELVDERGRTALDVAVEAGRTELTELLMAADPRAVEGRREEVRERVERASERTKPKPK